MFLLKNVNDSPAQIKELIGLLQGIRVNKIQLNTIGRPPAADVRGLSPSELEAIAIELGEAAEIIADISGPGHSDLGSRRHGGDG